MTFATVPQRLHHAGSFSDIQDVRALPTVHWGARAVRELAFDLPDGDVVRVTATRLLNAAFSARNPHDGAPRHAALTGAGAPMPDSSPFLYELPAHLAIQTDEVGAEHEWTSGEAEWALVVAGPSEQDLLLTAACDHADRLELAYHTKWGRRVGPDVLGRTAWRLCDVAARIDELTLAAWVNNGWGEPEIQRGTLAELLPPAYWVEQLRHRGLLREGTVLLSGTIPMRPEVDPFGNAWHVELRDPAVEAAITCGYRVRLGAEPVF
jgi:hypothetical protein